MKLVSFIAGGRHGYGLVKDGGVFDRSAHFGGRWPTLRDLPAAGGLGEIPMDAAPDMALTSWNWPR